MTKRSESNQKPNSIEEALGPKSEETPSEMPQSNYLPPEPTEEEFVQMALAEDRHLNDQYPDSPPRTPEEKAEKYLNQPAPLDNPLPSTPTSQTRQIPDPKEVAREWYPPTIPEHRDLSSSTESQPVKTDSTPELPKVDFDKEPLTEDEAMLLGMLDCCNYYDVREEQVGDKTLEMIVPQAPDDKIYTIKKQHPEWFEKAPPEPDLNLRRILEYTDSVEFSKSSVENVIHTITQVPRGVPFPNDWDMPKDVDLALIIHGALRQEQYVRAIYPLAKMMLGDNIANTFWAVCVLIQIAFFDVSKTISTVQEACNR